MSCSTRIFSFGLGHAPSRSLIKGLARATNGRFVFIPPNTSVDIYVGEQLQKALQPCITDVQIKINVDPTLVTIVPTKSPPVFINDRLIVYVILNNDKSASFDHNMSVELYSGQYLLCQAKVNRIPSVCNDGMIYRLAGKARILELQHMKSSNEQNQMTMQQIKEQIIEISLQHNILSPYTAFVGVEKRTNTSNDNMVLREVPIQISADNQYLKCLEAKLCEMRMDHCVQRDQAKLRHEARAIESHCHYLRDQVESRFSMINHLNRSFEQILFGTYENYVQARQQCTSALKKYDEAQQNLDGTTKSIDSIRNDYNEARKHLRDVSDKWHKVQCHYSENRRDTCDKIRRRFGTVRKNNDNCPYTSNMGIQYHNEAQKTLRALDGYLDYEENLDHVIEQFGNVQRHYDHLLQSIDEEHELQEKRSSEKSEKRLPKYMAEIDYVERRFEDVRHTLEHYQVEMYHIRDNLESTCASLYETMNKISDNIKYQENQMTVPYEIHRVEKQLRQEHSKQSSKKSQKFIRKYDQQDLDIVRRIIAEQKFDGLWNLEANMIEQLTGKPLSEFQQLTNTEMLISAIVIVVLETRFASLSSMWYGVVQKARTCLLNMLGKDNQKLATLLEDIQKQL